MSGNNCDPFSRAVWVGAPDHIASPIICRKFNIKTLQPSELFITGLGFFEAYINGHKITGDKFLPVVSDYEPRNTKNFLYPIYDKFTHRIYYYRFDITPYLQKGENLLQIHLGNGWYRQTERLAEGDLSFGNSLKTIYKIVLGNRRLISDGNEYWQKSQIIYNNLFIGEIHDARIEDQEKRSVVILPRPMSKLCEAIGTPDSVINTLTPRLIAQIKNEKIYDVGDNISGVVRVTASSEAGSSITLRFAERLNSDNTLNFASTGDDTVCASGRRQIMTDVFICNGNTCVFTPKFVWHSFRYFSVSGDADKLEIDVIHSDCNVTSRFDSSSEGLNFLYNAFIRTQLNNMHGSYPSDCPHRERLGYTGDGQVCSRAAMMMLDSKQFYKKWIQDILDCQDIGGHVQHTAPFMGGGGGPGGWGSAIVIVPYNYYKEFADADMLRRCFEPMCRWIMYMRSRLENGLITHEEKDGWCLGDWSTLEQCRIPEAFVNTYFFIKCLRLVVEIAGIIGDTSRVAAFKELDEICCQAIINAYRDDSGHFCGGIQGADAYAIDIDLADENIPTLLNEKYKEMGYFDTGFLGIGVLLNVLFSNGFEDTALSLLESEKPGSFLYMKNHGSTTIWEQWSNCNVSNNHPMLGGCSHHLFSSVLGISQQEGSAGYDKLLIKPCIPKKLQKASGSVVTIKGEIAVAFERNAGSVTFSITIPMGAAAIFEYEGKTVDLTEGEHKILV